jgi:hypothetical protein
MGVEQGLLPGLERNLWRQGDTEEVLSHPDGVTAAVWQWWGMGEVAQLA